MRIAFFLLFISILLCACAVENPAYRNDLISHNLKGRVKRTIEIISEIDSNTERVIKVGDSTIEDYDKYGSCTRSVTYDNKGAIKQEWIIRYEPKMIKTIILDSLIREKDYFKNASHGRLIQTVLTIRNEVNHGKYRGDKLEWDKSISFYNKKGSEDSVLYYKGDDTASISSKRFYKYDAKDHLIEEIWCDESGEIDKKISYEYDQRGNKIKETLPKDILIDTPRVHTFKYDDYGNESEAIYSSGENTRSPYGFNRKLTYDKYDNKHNWIQYTEFNGDKPVSRITRRIVYY